MSQSRIFGDTIGTMDYRSTMEFELNHVIEDFVTGIELEDAINSAVSPKFVARMKDLTDWFGLSFYWLGKKYEI